MAAACRVVIALSPVLVLAACTGTSATTDDYKHKVANSAQAVASNVQIALLDAQMVQDDKILTSDLTVSLEQAYADASSVVEGFDAVVPPHYADVRYQERLDSVAGHAVSVLQTMRIEVGQGREKRLADHIPDLQRIGKILSRLETIA